MMTDNVDHPPHYTKHPSGVEAIDICELLSFNLGNALKYVWRAKHKGNEKEDLKKALWYVRREQRLIDVSTVRRKGLPLSVRLNAQKAYDAEAGDPDQGHSLLASALSWLIDCDSGKMYYKTLQEIEGALVGEDEEREPT